MTETDTEKAASLDFFTSVYTVETDNDFKPPQSRIIDRSGHSKMLDVEFTVEDIIDKLAKLKLNNSPGLEFLHPRVLYETIHYFLIFKKRISVATLPFDWKLAEVTVIYKKRIKIRQRKL